MRMYNLTINNNNYEVLVKSVSLESANVEVNGEEHNITINEIKNIASPALMPQGAELKAIPTQSKAVYRKTPTPAKASGKSVSAPIPGQIKALFVKEGDSVKVGQKVLVMEAMKMENTINSDFDGVVKKVLIGDGDTVSQDQELILID